MVLFIIDMTSKYKSVEPQKLVQFFGLFTIFLLFTFSSLNSWSDINDFSKADHVRFSEIETKHLIGTTYYIDGESNDPVVTENQIKACFEKMIRQIVTSNKPVGYEQSESLGVFIYDEGVKKVAELETKDPYFGIPYSETLNTVHFSYSLKSSPIASYGWMFATYHFDRTATDPWVACHLMAPHISDSVQGKDRTMIIRDESGNPIFYVD